MDTEKGIEEKYYVIYEWYSDFGEDWNLAVDEFSDYHKAFKYHDELQTSGDRHGLKVRKIKPILIPFSK